MKKIDILDKSIPPRKLILMLVWPTVVEEFMSILVNYVDTAMVGAVGVNATASVSVSAPLINLTNALCIGLSSGFGILMSRYIGEGHKDRALKAMQQGMLFSLLFGILMTFLYTFLFADHFPIWMNAKEDIWQTSSDYLRWFGYSRVFMVVMFMANNILRGQGNTHTPMIANVTHNITNCVLNFFFIYETRELTWFGKTFTMPGLGYGVAGAAMATSIANVVATIIAFSALFRKSNTVPFSFKGFELGFEPVTLKGSMSISLPVAAERFTTNFGMLICTSLLAAVGNKVVAAHSLAGTGESICYMSVMGFGMAASTLVAQWLGAGDEEQAMLLAKKCIKYSAIVMAGAATILFFGAPFIIDIFTDDTEVIEMAALALRIQCVIEIIEGMGMTIGGVLRGAGDARYSTYSSLAGMWLVRVPAAYILIRFFHFGLLGVWIPMAIDWVVRFLILWFRYKSGKWTAVWNKQ